MFQRISTRLWLTYIFLTGTVLCVIAAGLMLYIFRSPAATRQLSSRLQIIAGIIQSRERFNSYLAKEQLRTAAQRLDEEYDARIILLDPEEKIVLDSRPDESAALPERIDRLRIVQKLASIPQFVDQNRKTWIFAYRALPDGYAIIVAAPRPELKWSAIFRDEFIRPFLQGGTIALLISIILSIAISRWIAKPLEIIAAAVRKKPIGTSDPIEVQGPREVLELASAYNEMNDSVRAAQKSQRDFVANVSHDLKTPLTSIQGFAQAIIDEAAQSPDQVKSAAQVIYDESERMNRMVNDLLELAKLDSGIAKLERHPVDLNELMSQLITRLKPFVDEKNIEVILPSQPLPTIKGDPDRLDRVFGNLMDNAIKFSPPSGSIEITGKVEDGFVLIAIQDHGPGIPTEDRERIFDRFYQTDKTRSKTDRGTGLGLTIAREIIHAHGGEIFAYNNNALPPFLGTSTLQGSTFLVRLPVIRSDDSTLVKRRESK
jgi:signal transduction histidine kinase